MGLRCGRETRPLPAAPLPAGPGQGALGITFQGGRNSMWGGGGGTPWGALVAMRVPCKQRGRDPQHRPPPPCRADPTMGVTTFRARRDEAEVASQVRMSGGHWGTGSSLLCPLTPKRQVTAARAKGQGWAGRMKPVWPLSASVGSSLQWDPHHLAGVAWDSDGRHGALAAPTFQMCCSAFWSSHSAQGVCMLAGVPPA